MDQPERIMMKALVAVASKHGSTYEIGEAIGWALAERGVDNDVRRVEDLSEIDAYDAVVVGSAVYYGQWIEPGRRFVEAFADELRQRPTWLFSSGPIGAPPRPAEADAVVVDDIIAQVRPREHHLFTGRIERSALGFAERAVLTAVRGAEGDFRDWNEIARWSATIADSLHGDATPTPSPPPSAEARRP
jgi:menaquinone-dependent protoporphyrinogen oxidase